MDTYEEASGVSFWRVSVPVEVALSHVSLGAEFYVGGVEGDLVGQFSACQARELYGTANRGD